MIHRESVLFSLSVLVAIQVFTGIILCNVILDMARHESSVLNNSAANSSNPNFNKTHPKVVSGRGKSKSRNRNTMPYTGEHESAPSTTSEYNDGFQGFGFNENPAPSDAVFINYNYNGNNGQLSVFFPPNYQLYNPQKAMNHDDNLQLRIVDKILQKVSRTRADRTISGYIWVREKQLLKMLHDPITNRIRRIKVRRERRHNTVTPEGKPKKDTGYAQLDFLINNVK